MQRDEGLKKKDESEGESESESLKRERFIWENGERWDGRVIFGREDCKTVGLDSFGGKMK